MGKMRKEFEAWCSSHRYTLRPAETNCGVIIDGQYGNQRVQIAWDAWKASRAALCVELPRVKVHAYYYNQALHDVAGVLEDIGVDYK